MISKTSRVLVIAVSVPLAKEAMFYMDMSATLLSTTIVKTTSAVTHGCRWWAWPAGR